MTREEKIEKLCDIINEIKLMTAEIMAADMQIRRNGKNIEMAQNAFDGLVNQIKLDDLVHFCNTGKYQV
jgi:hypothetical protein